MPKAVPVLENTNGSIPVVVDPVYAATQDVKASIVLLSPSEVRFLVDAYYLAQENRKRASNQAQALFKDEEPNDLVAWLGEQNDRVERSLRSALQAFANNKPLGLWAQGIKGIGPVITAGLLAHIDITRAPTVGHIWRFAGQDPTDEWKAHEKRPWNASLKRLCWIIGESFVKVSNLPDDIYGKVYRNRKELEESRNANGLFADQAADKLKRVKIGHSTDAYKAYSKGLLPPAHIHARAKRYAVKLFLAHYHHVAYELEYGKPPPLPYILAQQGHAHFIAPPKWPVRVAR